MEPSPNPSAPRTVPRWWIALALVAVIGLLGASCASEADELGEDEAVPAAGPPVFGDGDLSNVPLPAGAVAIGPRSEDEGVVTRTYGVEKLPPNEIADRMRLDLANAGWEQVFEFEETGRRVYRGEFTMDQQRLEVAIAPAGSLGETDPQFGEAEESVEGSQISLVLHPDLTGAPAYTGVPATEPEEESEVE